MPTLKQTVLEELPASAKRACKPLEAHTSGQSGTGGGAL